MPTTLLLDLIRASKSTDISDDTYGFEESGVRAMLIAALVTPDVELDFDPVAAEENIPEEDHALYLGSHLCGERKIGNTDDMYIELWSWDEDGYGDFATWNITSTDNFKYPIHFCPFCGLHLDESLITHD